MAQTRQLPRPRRHSRWHLSLHLPVLALALLCLCPCLSTDAFQLSPIGITTKRHPLSTSHARTHVHHVSPTSSVASPFRTIRTKPSSVLVPTSIPNPKASSTSLNAVLNPVVLTASLGATAKLLSSIGVGALTTPAGPKQFGQILDGPAVRALSKLTYWLFQPCFLLCGVASTLSKAASGGGGASGGVPTSALLRLPLAALIQISLGAIAAKVITTRRFGIRPRFLGIDTEDDAAANDIRMCTTFANSGPLPLILSDALFSGSVLSDVAACISFYLLVWSPLFWTFGKIIL